MHCRRAFRLESKEILKSNVNFNIQERCFGQLELKVQATTDMRKSPKRETCNNIFSFEGLTPMVLKAFDQYVPILASLYISKLPDAGDHAEANPSCVLGVAG